MKQIPRLFGLLLIIAALSVTAAAQGVLETSANALYRIVTHEGVMGNFIRTEDLMVEMGETDETAPTIETDWVLRLTGVGDEDAFSFVPSVFRSEDVRYSTFARNWATLDRKAESRLEWNNQSIVMMLAQPMYNAEAMELTFAVEFIHQIDADGQLITKDSNLPDAFDNADLFIGITYEFEQALFDGSLENPGVRAGEECDVWTNERNTLQTYLAQVADGVTFNLTPDALAVQVAFWEDRVASLNDLLDTPACAS